MIYIKIIFTAQNKHTHTHIYQTCMKNAHAKTYMGLVGTSNTVALSPVFSDAGFSSSTCTQPITLAAKKMCVLWCLCVECLHATCVRVRVCACSRVLYQLITSPTRFHFSSPVRLSWIAMSAVLFITQNYQIDIKCMKRGMSEQVNENETLFTNTAIDLMEDLDNLHRDVRAWVRAFVRSCAL